MAYDIVAARQAGLSDSEIADYLAQKRGYDIQGARNAGLSDGEVLGHLLSKEDVGGATQRQGGLKRAWDRFSEGANATLSAPLAGLVEGVADATGATGLRDSARDWRENAERYVQQKEEENPTYTFSEADSVGDYLNAGADALLTNAPQLVLGGAAAKGAAMAAGGVARLAGLAKTADTMNKVKTAAALTGGAAQNIAVETGSIYNDQEEKDLLKAAAYGTAAGLVETGAEAFTVARSGLGKYIADTAKESAIPAFEKAGLRELTKQGLKTSVQGGLAEGTEELIQNPLEHAGASKQFFTADGSLDPNLKKQMYEGFMGGAFIGGALGGGGHVYSTAQNKAAVQALASAETDPETRANLASNAALTLPEGMREQWSRYALDKITKGEALDVDESVFMRPVVLPEHLDNYDALAKPAAAVTTPQDVYAAQDSAVETPDDIPDFVSTTVADQGTTQAGVTDAQDSGNRPNALALRQEEVDTLKVVNDLISSISSSDTSGPENLVKSGRGNAKRPGNRLPALSFRKQLFGFLNVPTKGAGAGINTLADQAVSDGLAADAHLFGNLADAQAIRSEGFNNLSIKRQRMVQSHVVSALNNPEVFKSVVQLVPIDVVNMLAGGEFSPQQLVDNQSVLLDALSSSLDDSVKIGGFVDSVASSLPQALALRVTKEIPTLSDSPRATDQFGTTIGALDNHAPPPGSGNSNYGNNSTHVNQSGVLNVKAQERGTGREAATVQDAGTAMGTEVLPEMPIVDGSVGSGMPVLRDGNITRAQYDAQTESGVMQNAEIVMRPEDGGQDAQGNATQGDDAEAAEEGQVSVPALPQYQGGSGLQEGATPLDNSGIPDNPSAPRPLAKEPWGMTREELAKEHQKALSSRASVEANYAGSAYLARDLAGKYNTQQELSNAIAKETATRKQALADVDNRIKSLSPFRHEAQIKQALAEGRTVPPEVLADYPDLQRAQETPALSTRPADVPKEGPDHIVDANKMVDAPLTPKEKKEIVDVIEEAENVLDDLAESGIEVDSEGEDSASQEAGEEPAMEERAGAPEGENKERPGASTAAPLELKQQTWGKIDPYDELVDILRANGERVAIRQEETSERSREYTVTVENYEDIISAAEALGFTTIDHTDDGGKSKIVLEWDDKKAESMPEPVKTPMPDRFKYVLGKPEEPKAAVKEEPAAKAEGPEERPATKPEKDDGKESYFRKGDRVQLGDGSHGKVSDVTSYVVKTALIGLSRGGVGTHGLREETNHTYKVLKDNGVDAYTSFSDMQHETDPAPEVVPAPVYQGEAKEPEALQRGIEYDKKAAQNARGALARARTTKSKEAHRLDAERREKDAADKQAVLDAWKQKYPDEARRVFGEEKKQEAPAQAAPASVEATTGTKLSFHKTTHTKKGHDLFVVSIDERVERPEYERLKGAASKLGGSYSAYRGKGAIPGFQFRDEQKARQFMAEQSGQKYEAPKVELPAGVVQPEGSHYWYRKEGNKWAYSANKGQTWGNPFDPPLDFQDKLETLLAAQGEEATGKQDLQVEPAEKPKISYNDYMASVYARLEKDQTLKNAAINSDRQNYGLAFMSAYKKAVTAALHEYGITRAVAEAHDRAVKNTEEMLGPKMDAMREEFRRGAVAETTSTTEAVPPIADARELDRQARAAGKDAFAAGKPRQAPSIGIHGKVQEWYKGWDLGNLEAQPSEGAASPKFSVGEYVEAIKDKDLFKNGPYRIAHVDSQGNIRLEGKGNAHWLREDFVKVAAPEKTIWNDDGTNGPVAITAPPKAENKVFTQDAYEKAKARMKSKLSQVNSGFDPELMQDGITIAGYHLESGARTFAAYAKAMITDFGDSIKPYLKAFYNGVRDLPGIDHITKEMDDYQQVSNFNVDRFTPELLDRQIEQDKLFGRLPADYGIAQAQEPDIITNESTTTEGGAEDAISVGQREATDPDDRTGDEGQSAEALPGTEGEQYADLVSERPGRGDDGELRPSIRGSQVEDTEQAEPGQRGTADDGATGSVGKRPRNVAGVRGRDYRIGHGGLKREGSWKATAARNLDIIELAKKLKEENRPATVEEQELLSKYTGWGASEIANSLFPGYSQHGKVYPNWAKPEWKELVERLDSVLTPEEIKTAARSTQYAHYTSEAVIRSIWKALGNMGFPGGKILEPGAGIGHFAGLMPDGIHKNSRYTGVEFDGVTAAIAQALYPEQNILHADYTRQKFPNDFFDLAIGNPPFSRTQILVDPDYRKYKFSLHDYFFAKTMDKVRPGGILVFVTSRYTMDKLDDKARGYLADRADFLGAIRLPQTAFQQNAGTEVVTDVIFLRKREEGAEAGGEKWLGHGEVQTAEGPAIINEYFVAHPEMILGRSSLQGSMYGKDEYTVLPNDGDIEEHFSKAVENLPANVYSVAKRPAKEQRQIVTERDYNPKNKKEGGIYLSDKGELMRVEHGSGVPLASVAKLTDRETAFLKEYVGLRDLLKQARYDQFTEGDWEKSLKGLNKAYDAFVKKHGSINEFTVTMRTETDEDGNASEVEYRRFKNAKVLRQDVEGPLVEALEVITEAGKIIKAPMLEGRTIKKPERGEVKTVSDALAVSLDEVGTFDPEHVAGLLGVSVDEIIDSLGDMAYQNPNGGKWELADEYLSGDVVSKLEEAEAAAKTDPKFLRNVEALTKAQPKPLTAKDITVNLGATWVNKDYIEDFASEVLGLNVSISHNQAVNNWRVNLETEGGSGYRRRSKKAPGRQSTRNATSEWGTPDRGPNELLESLLNRTKIVITRTDYGPPRTTYTDQAATAGANEVAKKMAERFKSWVWEDADRAADLLQEYNRRFNNIAPRRFDGSHLTLPGASTRYKLHPHQKRAIWRVIQTGNTYLSHAVGAGKTIEMIAAGMEMRRLGMIRKPLYVVPNHMLQQFASEFIDLYPMANIMVADEENFHTDNRRRFMAQAAVNDPDAIIITHSSLGKLKLKPENVRVVKDELLSELREAYDEAKDDGAPRYLTKRMEQRIEQAEQRFDSITGGENADDVISFEEMGVDFMIVDEAHEFRKLDFTTNQQIKGIDPNGSKKALDLYLKTRYLNGQRPGRGFVFASGTPITNTMGELYTVMRFFDDEGMDRDGIRHFDAWSAMFGDTADDYEPNAAGRYELVTRFSKFQNLPELSKRVRQFMDVLTSSQLGAYVVRPDLKGGQAEIVVTPASDKLKEYQQTTLQPRLESSREWKPTKDQPNNPDPVINIITDGRLSSIDMRFADPTLKNDQDSKLNQMIDKIIESHKEIADLAFTGKDGKPEAIKGGTQIVFFNHGFGEGVKARRGFDARKWMMERFKAAGIPASEVAWIEDYPTAAKKEAMFADMRSGKKKILIGSAKKMGTGVNVQRRLTVLHYLDAPWYPSDVEQPHGRILRQGNQNKEVAIYWYATKGSYDSTMWQMVGRKAKFIQQFFEGDDNLRSMEDISEVSQYEMAKALSSGDERVIKLVGLQAEIEKLSRLKEAHAQAQYDLRYRKGSLESEIKFNEGRIKDLDEALKKIGGYSVTFSGKVGSKEYTTHKEFGEALSPAYNKAALEALSKLKGDKEEKPQHVQYGTLNGFPLVAEARNHWSGEKHVDNVLIITPKVKYRIDEHQAMYPDGTDPVGLARKVVNRLQEASKEKREKDSTLEEKRADLKLVEKKYGAPYEHERNLAEKTAEAAQLQAELVAEGQPIEAPEGGEVAEGQTLDFLGLQQLYERIAGSKTVKDAVEYLHAMGRQLFTPGMKYQDFAASMKQSLRDQWERFKGQMVKVYQTVKSANDRLGERGSIELPDGIRDAAEKVKDTVADQISAIRDDLSEATLTDMLKKGAQLANPFDFSRSKEFMEKHTSEAVRGAIGDIAAIPFFQAERDPAKKGLYRNAVEREVDRLSDVLAMFGGLGEVKNRSRKDELLDLLRWGSGDKLTAWEQLKAKYNLTRAQKKAFNVLVTEGDAYRTEYSTLQSAQMNRRIKAAGVDAHTFAFYKEFLEHQRQENEVKIELARRNMEEAGISPEEIEGHIAEYRERYANLEGWMHRDHGDGEIRVTVHHEITKLRFDVDQVTSRSGQKLTRVRLPYYPGGPLLSEMEKVVEQHNGKIKVVEPGAVVIFSANPAIVSALNEIELIGKSGKPRYRVMVYSRYVNTKGQAEKLKEELKKNLAGHMPHNYREGEQYRVADAHAGMGMEGPGRISDMKVEHALRRALEKGKKRGDLTAEEHAALEQALVQDTAEVLMGEGAGLYQIRRAPYLIEGYDTDNAIGLYESYVNGVAGMLSKARYALRQHKALGKVPRRLQAWAYQYVADSLRNMGRYDKASANARGIAALWFMALKPASVVINLTQPYILGQAELSRFTKSPVVKILKAQKDILKGSVTGEERQIFETEVYLAQERETAVAELTGYNEDEAARLMRAVVGRGMAVFQKAEVFNRKTMILAAYRVFRETMDQDAALAKALEVNSSVNFDVGRANLPRFARNPVGRTIYALQTFTFNTLNWMYNRATTGEKADMVALVRLFSAFAVLGGLGAMPFGDEIFKLLRRLTGRDYQEEFKGWMKREAGDGMVGEAVNRFVNHGAGGMLGVSIGNSLAVRVPVISSLLSGEGLGRSFGGVFGGLWQKGETAVKAAARGNTYRAIEAVAPEAIANPMRAYRGATEGQRTIGGKPLFYQGKPLTLTTGEALRKVAGFQSPRITDITEARTSDMALKEIWDEKRKETVDEWRLSRKLKGVHAFNKEIREAGVVGLVNPITADTLLNAARSGPDRKRAAYERENH